MRNNEIQDKVAAIQEKTAILPDYNLDSKVSSRGGTTVAGIIGVAITTLFVTVIGLLLKKRKVIKE